MLEGTLFGDICDIIILISAVTLAIINIYKFFAKPTSALKKKSYEAEKHRVEAIIDTKLNEKMPDILYNHDLETRDKYRGDRYNYLLEIKKEVEKDINQTIQEIHQLLSDQNKKIAILTDSSKDVLREKIMMIYHQYKKQKRMPQHAREALDQYYKDYKKEDGNSYIDKYYARMKSWETYEDDYEE